MEAHNPPEDRAAQVLERLRSLANPQNAAGMRRFGINAHNTLGISIYTLRPLAKELGRSHSLARALWDSGIHEARILAAYVAEPARVSAEEMDAWVVQIDSWDVCDQVCSSLWDQTPLAVEKALEWSRRPEEFVKRAGFVLMAALSVHAKDLPDPQFEPFFEAILREAGDERNFVKKAVNWALRQIGKRNLKLNRRALEVAERLQQQTYADARAARAARWVAADAMRELNSEKVQKRLKA